MTTGLLTTQKPAGNEDMGQFLRDIRQFPRLTPEQERQLAMGCAAGDRDAIRQMVNSNLGLVVSVAREYAGRGVPLMDLIQEGSIGLLAAAEKFDYTLDYRFSTYATKWIRQGVTRCLTDDSLIRVPTHTAQQIRRVSAAKAELAKELGEEPSLEALAERCEISPERAERLLRLKPETCSLDAPVGEEADALGILLTDMQSPQPHEELIREELNRVMDNMLSMLTERQSMVLRLHFGMEDGVCHSLEEIGKLLDISKERARQIEQQAMDKLQKLGTSMGLEDFLE